jgi:small GTP-binding protein
MESQMEYDSFKKVLIFGNAGSGKTSLVERLERGSFTEGEKLLKNEFITQKLTIENDQIKKLNINLYEIRIDENFNKNQELIDSFLYECQCALFLVDITNLESFELIQSLISNIEINKYPYLKMILIQNKCDQEDNRKISKEKFGDFINKNNSIESLEISSKDGKNIPELINKINIAVNESKNKLPSNIVSETQGQKKTLMNVSGSLSLVLVGDSQVGKTCLVNRYFKNKFDASTLSNIGIDKDIKFVKIGEEELKLTVWDTVGQERFRALPKKYYQNADGVLLLFDVTKEDTFLHVNDWIKDVKDNSNKENDVVIYILGNKIDMPERVITKEKAEEFSKSLGLKYFEISCKINMNIPEVMARMIMECHMKNSGIKDVFQLKPAKKGEHRDRRRCCH